MNEYSNERRSPAEGSRHGPRRRLSIVIPSLLIAGAVGAACGSNSANTAASTTTGAPAGNGGGSVTVDATTMANVGTILVTSRGFALYRLSTDSMNKSNCDSSCAKVWPPLLVTGGSPVAGSGVSGLGTIDVAGGKQVTYNGMPLYTYVGDTASGQDRGQGLKDNWGTWFVVVTKAAPGGATTTTAGGGGGVGF
ncbi:MAG TPA: hypothetical protein VGS21_11255 [Acidimicrobiales bacterium]|nr:hypothetical protein [Acidimicrobiales bacterium]